MGSTGSHAGLALPALRCVSAGALPIAGFDASCAAMAQGPDRFSRAKSYSAHVTQRHGVKHEFVPVPLCGHNNRCIWTADIALPVLFPKL